MYFVVVNVLSVFCFRFESFINRPCFNFCLFLAQYAGFVNATKSGDNTLHYWFAEAENKWTKETPFLVWLNGGPVCAVIFVICESDCKNVVQLVNSMHCQLSSRNKQHVYAMYTMNCLHLMYIPQMGYSALTGLFVTDRVIGRETWASIDYQQRHTCGQPRPNHQKISRAK